MTPPAPAPRLRTHLLLFDDVEVLDFAGPFEVFALTDELAGHTLFEVRTVAPTTAAIRARHGLRVVPDHALAAAPPADLLLIPGGAGTRALLDQPAVLEWVRGQSATARHTVSICTGALVLARAGLLDGLDVTTHWENLAELRAHAPLARVQGDRRFHDHGRILTAAGISAGLDVSLHLVARLHGVAVAERTARTMEYSWRDDHGATR